MVMAKEFFPNGVIPAVLLPFRSDLQIDEPAYRGHLRDLLAIEGIAALTVNGHSSEVHALSFDEQKRVLEISVDEVRNKMPIICGIYTDSSNQLLCLRNRLRLLKLSVCFFPKHRLYARRHFSP
jgi:4-hydroxy-tetrahydrodipicolinate synthase